MSRFPKAGFMRGVWILISGTALGQLVIIIASPVLTRIYSPEEFGVLAVYASLLMVISTLASFRYEFAIPLPSDGRLASSTLALSFILLLASSTTSAFFIYICAEQITAWTNLPGIRSYLWLLPIGSFAVGAYHVLRYWAIRQNAFSRIARTKINQGVSNVALQIGLGLLQVGPIGLILGQVAGNSAGIFTLAKTVHRKDIERVSWGGMKEVLLKYRKFPLLSAPMGLVSALGQSIPSLLLAGLYGVETAGFFLLANRIVNLPVQVVGESVATTYYSKAVQVRHDRNILTSLFFSVSRNLAILGLAIGTVLGLFGAQLFVLIFGPNWTTAGTYTSVLAILLAARLVVNPLSSTLAVIEHQQLTPIVHGLMLIVPAGSILVAHQIGFTALPTILLYSISSAVTYVGVFYILRYALGRYTVPEELAGEGK